MTWRERAALSHYRTAVAIRQELEARHYEEAARGMEELIEALSRSERRALKCHLIRLMAHVVKWQSQQERRSRGWVSAIKNGRSEIRDIQDETPSLGDDVIRAMWVECFRRAKLQAEGEMDHESPIASLSWDEVFEQEYRLVSVDEIVTTASHPIPADPPQPRVAGLHAGAIQTTPDFDEPLADDFWTGQPMDPETEDR